MEQSIGFDGIAATNDINEAGAYSRLLISQLALARPLSKFLVYTPKLPRGHTVDSVSSLHNIELRLPPPQGFHGSLWRAFGITNNLQADGVKLFHGLNGELPLNIEKSRIPAVVTIHDVLHRTVPENFSALERKIREYRIKSAVLKADRIIAPSEYIKGKLIEFYNANPDKIDVIYQPCDDIFRRSVTQDEIASLRSRLNLPKKFILQHGSLDRNSNLEMTVRALSALNPQIELVVVGKDHKGYKKRVNTIAEELGITGRIHYYPEIPVEDLPALYRMAEVIVYPELSAGNGVNLLQGLESGRPVAAAADSCYEEFGGPDTLYFDSRSQSDMVSALNAIIFGGREIEDMASAGKEYAARFTASDFLARHLKICSALCHNFEKN